ncbi:hypothetical protein BWR18_01690 [Tateyamaria omphalii]|uniref:Uncharacterized protein n=2 Tax=Tateyamaria omphalii TaxID=299262 RepID=A0A1P8MR76_9RHOB|nr:hypothetical protein BWR18_01690 [Tateyamaria omphalii]
MCKGSIRMLKISADILDLLDTTLDPFDSEIKALVRVEVAAHLAEHAAYQIPEHEDCAALPRLIEAAAELNRLVVILADRIDGSSPLTASLTKT